ncbi:MAG: TRAP transporter substrate-binding protein DctP [Alphaproteobacteria bacterium]|nr:TRAP transporter substrate-binding protein DctP [Alphaproteobacteria bacterium]
MKRILRAMLGVAAIAAGVAGVPHARPATAQEVQWKMHVVFVPAREETKAYQRWAERVNARTAGKLKITVYPGGELGVKDVDLMRILPAGNVVQAAGLVANYLSRDAPEIANLLPPGIMLNEQRFPELLPMLDTMFQKIYDKWGVKLLTLMMAPNHTIEIFCRQPVSTLEQLRRVKLRVWEKAQVDTFAKLGVAASIIPQAELYIAMQTGVVDCSTYLAGFATTISLQEVAPHFSFITPYALHPHSIVLSKKAFDALPADVQKILQEEGDRTRNEMNEKFTKGGWEEEQLEKLLKAGGKRLPPFPEADRRAIYEAARQAGLDLAKRSGPEATTNYQAIIAAMDKLN